MIRLANQTDIAAITKTYTDLLVYEQQHGSKSNWKLDVYPTIEIPKNSIPQGTMYVLEDNGEICASMILNHEQANEYKTIKWKYDRDMENVLVIHTLCIPPHKARYGYGQQMVEYAKKYALRTGCTTIRIDTYAHNEPAKQLYIQNGFRIAGHGQILLHDLIAEDQIYLEYKV